MNGYDLIEKINSLAKCPEKYRSNWKPRAEKLADKVRDIIERLRKFALLQAGFVADRCETTAADLEEKLAVAMGRFE